MMFVSLFPDVSSELLTPGSSALGFHQVCWDAAEQQHVRPAAMGKMADLLEPPSTWSQGEAKTFF